MTEVSINKQARLSQHLTSSSVATLGHSSELDGSRLSPHFTLGELCKTSAKTQDGNIPSHVHIENLKRLCGWLEMLRDEWNRRYGEGNDPIIINSGYRSEAVNKAVGGVAGSNHLTGCAVDIHVLGKEQAIRYACILLDIADESQEDFDELLIEQSKTSLWIHFAVRPFANRRKVKLM
ncbi:MAG: hypothetical protein IJQ49_00930 [Prevotella sp.]|nr:hypothetical protein [Prevotella sp.]